MRERTLMALEFFKVLEQLASFCLSEAGAQQALLLRPLPDFLVVEKAQHLHEQILSWRAEGEFKLASFPNIESLFDLLQGHDPLLEQEALWAVKEVLSLAQRSVESAEAAASRFPLLWEMMNATPLPRSSLAGLNRCLSDDGTLRDESSPGLLLVRGELRSLHQGCTRKVKEYANIYNISHYLQDEYMTLASDRYVLPLKANFKGRLQGIIHDYSHSGETLYFEPMFLVEQNNRLQELKQQEREEERKVLRLLTDLLLQEIEQVKGAWQLLLNLDLGFAKCALGQALDARIVPFVEDSPQVPAKHTYMDSDETDLASLRHSKQSQGALHILQGRHPLLVLENAAKHQKAKVQPIDILLRPHDHILIISGGNAGGKTVALKTLGLFVLMSLCGLPVPAGAGSTLPHINRVHAFIGDEQSLEEQVSTFTGQIQHLSKVWENVGPNALILLDEFGAGTDPSQGAALAQAVLDGLLKKQAYVLTATHFPALKTYALTHDGVRAASVLFDSTSRKPLFSLAYDQIGASLALDVAREHGLPESVLQKAQQYLLLDGDDSRGMIDRLNSLAQQREQELEELRQEEAKTKDKRQRLAERFEKERKALHDEVRQKSQELMQAWKSGKATAKQALRDMSSLRAQLRTPVEENAKKNQTITVGQTVRHKAWNKTAAVLEVDEKGGKVRMDMNGVTLWTKLADVELASTAPTPAAPMPSSGAKISSSPVYLRLDLRGKRADLALAELETFLDRALLAGPDGVEVLHGRGTGALRKAVHEFLKTFPGIAEYACAPEDQGGDGITLVTFRS